MSNPDEYFTSYEDISVHRLMLEDEVRTKCYQKAILGNKHFFEGKTILDVGCGSGVLSVFCAQAGAKKVHAVEASNMAKLAVKIVKENKFESVIEVHHTRIENLNLDGKVDIIVSEWMGFFLLHEGMIDSVLNARDRFLKPEGVLFPYEAEIWLAPCELPQYFDFWKNIYGVKMSCLGEYERKIRSAPEITLLDNKFLLSEPVLVKTITMKNADVNDLRNINFNCFVPTDREGKLQGICLWFTCKFKMGTGIDDLVLNTAPKESSTHWKQTAVVLPSEKSMEMGEPITFDINISQMSENSRKYNIELIMKDYNEVKHPIPCNCYMTKCIVIKAFLEQNKNMEEDDILSEDEESTELK